MAYEDVLDEISKGIAKGAKEAEAEKKQEQPKQEEKKEEKEDMKEKFLRLAAEFDNYKKRTRKDLDDAAMIGRASLVKEMLPVVDEFELAMLAMGKEGDKDILKGITMLYSNFMDTLKRNGLSEISCEGRADPFRHEVVMVMESKEKEGTVLQVVKKGYEFNGRLIRPASVIVAKAAEEKKESKK